MFSCEIDHIEQTELDYIEFLFNTRAENFFLYARNEMIVRDMGEAVLYHTHIPYLAPELVLLYKSTDIKREGYQQDFDRLLDKMDDERKLWLKNALEKSFPDGHKWIEALVVS